MIIIPRFPGCSRMIHVPGFIDDPREVWQSFLTWSFLTLYRKFWILGKCVDSIRLLLKLWFWCNCFSLWVAEDYSWLKVKGAGYPKIWWCSWKIQFLKNTRFKTLEHLSKSFWNDLADFSLDEREIYGNYTVV